MKTKRATRVYNRLCSMEPLLSWLAVRFVSQERPDLNPDKEGLRAVLRIVNHGRRRMRHIAQWN